MSASAAPAPRSAPPRRSTWRSGTLSGRRPASHSTRCSAARPGTISASTIPAPDELAAELLQMSIASMKIWPFDFAAGALDGIKISPEDLKAGMAPFEAIRKAHGDRMSIKAELHGIWGLGAAKAICAALESIGPDWVEDPIWMDRTADFAELTACRTRRLRFPRPPRSSRRSARP